MAENSSEPAETMNPQVFALEVAKDWVAREGGRTRAAAIVGALLESTITAIARGEEAPDKESATLLEIWRSSRDGAPAGPGSPLRGSEIERWWEARAEHLRQACSAEGAEWLPRLRVKPGGGRGLPTLFQIALDRLEPSADTESESALPREDGILRYRVSLAKPALWLRLLMGSRPFPMDSWRGHLLVCIALVDVLLICFIWLGIYMLWSQPRAVSTADLALAGLAAVVSFFLWRGVRPVWQLPSQRVTLAGASFLALSELHGQLRTMPTAGRREAGRVFSVVRHWGICPVCSAEVDIQDGGRQLPGRLVGRCADAPLEHVFSFDPVLLTGRLLR